MMNEPPTTSMFIFFMFMKIAKLVIIAGYLLSLYHRRKTPSIEHSWLWLGFIIVVLFLDGVSWPMMWAYT